MVYFASFSQGIFSMRAKDDSMSPVINFGDIVIASKNLPFENDEVYLVPRPNGEVLIRSVSKVKEGYKFVPMNSQYPEEFSGSKAGLIRVIQIIAREEHAKA